MSATPCVGGGKAHTHMHLRLNDALFPCCDYAGFATRGTIAACILWTTIVQAGEQAPTAIWLGGSGNWSDPANWNTNIAVDTQVFNAAIDNGNPVVSTAFIDVDATINGMIIDSSDSVHIQDGRMLGFTPAAKTLFLANSGLLSLESPLLPTSLIIDGGTLEVTGGGTIQLTHESYSRILGSQPGDALNNVNNVILGAGVIGSDSLVIHNWSIIDANLPFQRLQIDPSSGGFDNDGILQASQNGRLQLVNGTFENTQGLIRALNGSRVDLDGSTIIGGQLTSSGNGLLRVQDAPATLQNTTIAGQFELGPTKLTLLGTILNSGAIHLVADATFAPGELAFSELIIPPGAGDVTLSGTGSMDMWPSKVWSGASGVVGGRLIHAANHTITGEALFGLDTATVINHGTIVADRLLPMVFDPADADPMTNTGTLKATGAGGMIFSDGSFTNDGVIEVLDGSRAVFTASASLSNLSFGMLSGGEWRVIGSESNTILLVPGPGVQFNLADVTLSGSTSVFSLMNTMQVNAGRFAIENGRSFTTLGPFFSNDGELEIGLGSVFTATGGFSQSSAGTLRVTLIDPELGISDCLHVSGPATLSGTLEIDVQQGYFPQPGQTFEFLTAGSVVGAFDRVILPAGYNVSYGQNAVTVTVTAICDADVNGDGIVSIDDLVALMDDWGLCLPPPAPCDGDVNGDGAVDVDDLLFLIDAWGACL